VSAPSADECDGAARGSWFMGTEIEMLVAGNCILYKDRENPALILDYRNAFDPD
jgi:hypothetical protein